MFELITIAKPGEPKIRILLEHLEEHERLGWQRVLDDVEETAEELEQDVFDIETATGKQLKAFLASLEVPIPAGTKVDDLRVMAREAKAKSEQGADE